MGLTSLQWQSIPRPSLGQTTETHRQFGTNESSASGQKVCLCVVNIYLELTHYTSYEAFPRWWNLKHLAQVMSISFADSSVYEDISKVCFWFTSYLTATDSFSDGDTCYTCNLNRGRPSHLATFYFVASASFSNSTCMQHCKFTQLRPSVLAGMQYKLSRPIYKYVFSHSLKI